MVNKFLVANHVICNNASNWLTAHHACALRDFAERDFSLISFLHHGGLGEIDLLSKKCCLIQTTPRVLIISSAYVILWDSLFKIRLFLASQSIRNNCKYRAEVRVSPDGILLVDINDTDVNENYFLSEPQETFHPRQTDFESVKKNSDKYIQIIEQEMNKLVIFTHVISRPCSTMLSLLTT